MSKYKRENISFGNNKLSQSFNLEGQSYSKDEIISSWKKAYCEKVSRDDNGKGLHLPQFGALSAIRAHWVTSRSPATIVMPTGTGKSETMFTTIISERIKSTLIIVPSDLLRTQIFNGSKEFGILPEQDMISEGVIFPNSFLYKSRTSPEDEPQLIEAFRVSNIIVSTPTMIKNLSPVVLNELVNQVEVVIFDEAHHLAAPDWRTVRDKFIDKKVLQFTATPFRNDGKRIDGKIIFNYPLALAQKEGYFKPIDFYPIQEFNESKSDEEIAKIAIQHLKEDLKLGLDHVLLARAKTKARANELYRKIYSKYTNLNPVVIHSGLTSANKKKNLSQLREGNVRIVVCVDMFGEGIDIPTLKIAAIHDKYKSLPITLQFIGRFARTSGNKLGNAKLITNIGMEDLKEGIDELYHQDSDWNKLLNIHSNHSIDKEIVFSDFLNNFLKESSDIDLSEIRMKVSTRMFRNTSTTFLLDSLKDVLQPERTMTSFNDENSVYIFIEQVETNVVWSNQKDILEYSYEFFVIYLDKKNGIIHINETNGKKGNQLIEKIFPNSMSIKGDAIYRALDGINRLMLGTLGLKQIPNGRISFRMFAGTDIKSGINQAVISGSTKSNLFGYGYQNGKRISIGCSYKGKVWMRWVERINFWTEWCDDIGNKVLDESINTLHTLENSLVSEQVSAFPDAVPYKITLPENIEVSNSTTKQLLISNEDIIYPFFQTELKNPKIENNYLTFEFWIDKRKFGFKQVIEENSHYFEQIEGATVFVSTRNSQLRLSEYLQEYSPEIAFIQEDGSVIVVQENLQTVIKPKRNIELNSDSLFSIDWNTLGTNIKSESQFDWKSFGNNESEFQGSIRKKDSIQYVTIKNIVSKDSQIIFDDDGSGEIADIISITIDKEKNKITFHLYHCKYSQGETAGSRVGDLYEVCGQAEKSIMWNDNLIEMVDRMRKREKVRQHKYNETRLEKGEIETLLALRKMIKAGFETEFEISIVQPGVSISKLTPQMRQIILATDSHLKDTYGIELKCYFSS